MGMSTHGGERRVCPTALQPPPHLLTTLPVPAGSGRCGSQWHGGHRRRPCGGAEPGAPRGRLGRERPGPGAERAWAGSRRTAQARGRAGDGVVDELRPARAATTYRPRAWDGQRASSPPSGAEVVPAGTADRGRRAERRRSRFPTSGAARESTTHPSRASDRRPTRRLVEAAALRRLDSHHPASPTSPSAKAGPGGHYAVRRGELPSEATRRTLP